MPDRNAFVMRSAPLRTETWKDQLLRGEVSLELATAVGRAYQFLLERRMDEGPLGENRARGELLSWWAEQSDGEA